MVAYGCTTTMHVVQLLAPRLDKEDPMKEMDFSPAGIRARWKAGYENTNLALARAAWTREFSTIEGVILHPLDTPDPEEPANETIADAAG